MTTDGQPDEASPPLPARTGDGEAGSAGSGSTEGPEGVEEIPPEGVDRLVAVVMARIENRLEQHLHLPSELPPIEQAIEMREKTPELYELWLNLAKTRGETSAYVARAPYEEPSRAARQGRPWALVALFAVLGFCAYLASLGTTGTVMGGIIGALDLVGILAVFAGVNAPRPSENRGEISPKADDSDKSDKDSQSEG